MKDKKKLFLILISILLVAIMCFTVVACSKNGGDDEEDPYIDDNIKKDLLPTEALNKIYSGLVGGRTEMESASTYGVENVFTMYVQSILNYTVSYKANYNANPEDSEIYISVFDNNAHKDRITVFYNGKDLFIDRGDKKDVVSTFGSTMYFGSFLAMCRQLDMTSNFYADDKIASIFNTSNTLNLGIVLDKNNISYNKAGETGEVVEIQNLDMTLINDTISFEMDRAFKGIDAKFDIITQKYLGFNLSRLLESRFAYIYADTIEMDIHNQCVTDSYWKMSGSLRDTSKYWMEANVGYNSGTDRLEEGSSYLKSQYTEATLGENDFEGTILIPAIDKTNPFDMEVVTYINSKDNSLNKMNLRIYNATGSDFISMFYTDGTAFLDATGLYNWVDGAIDLDAFNLPKIYMEGFDMSKAISAGYMNLSKMLMVMIKNLNSSETTDKEKEIYNKLLDNFYSENNTIYLKITEKLIQDIRENDETMMTMVAKMLGIEEKLLASYIGEDFFSNAELIIGYNLDNGVLSLRLNQRGEMLFYAELVRKDFKSIFIPSDCNVMSATYAPAKYPDVITLEVDANLNVRNGKAQTDASKLFGVFVGDTTGRNTPYTITNEETINVRGTVTQSVLDNTRDNFVNISVYSIMRDETKLLFNVCTNPYNYDEYLVAYYLPIGSCTDHEGLFFKIDREVLKEGFQELLGEDNIFDNANVLSILSNVMSLEGISTIEKKTGWFEFSLIAQGDRDPVNELVGIKDTTARVKARAIFRRADDDVDIDRFIVPVITDLKSYTIDSIYSEGSMWHQSVEVCIDSYVFFMIPAYVEETIKITTGKNVYHPVAKLFGLEFTYEVKISTGEGTYKIVDLYSRELILDPTETGVLPDMIQVKYDNNTTGYLPCTFKNFDESNITIAGYNLAGFAGDYDKCTVSKVVIGVDSIMAVEYDIYILVNNRSVIADKNQNGESMYAPGNIPVVGVITVDPYTYAMKVMDKIDYNPIYDLIEKDDLMLFFNNVYGEETVEEGDESVVRELTYDRLGINYFHISELDLDWEYNLEKITWMGSSDYAYAKFGTNGTVLTLAIKVNVTAQTVEYIKIDDESNGQYTIDFLSKDTYTIPSQSSFRHTLELYFVTDDLAVERKRKLVVARPDGISDDDYYENYVYGSLNWEGADYITSHPSVITVNGTANLFGSITGISGNYTTARFGSELCVGTQTVGININVPTRYQSAKNTKEAVAANICTIVDNQPIYGDIGQIQVSPASFTKDGEIYAPYGMNPYDLTARLPSTIFLTVAHHYDRSEDSFYDENGNNRGNAVVKEYNVNWVTTDTNGKELNFIELKEDNRYGLKNPVVTLQDFVVYGRVGDRGQDKEGNLGYVWVKMIVRNLASELKNVKFDDISLSEIEISIDPYLPYTLPRTFEAQLQDNDSFVHNNEISWLVSLSGTDIWYPINLRDATAEQMYDERGLSRYDDNGKFIFPYTGGNYDLKFVLEGSTDVIRQEIILPLNIPNRYLVTTDGKTNVDVYDNGGFVTGYFGIDGYDKTSSVLYDRLTQIKDGGDISVQFDRAVDEDGRQKVYSLPIVWFRASEGESNYEHSIDYLLSLFVGVQEGKSIVVWGTIGTGTVNEQEIFVDFAFSRNILASIGMDRLYIAVEEESVSIDEMTGSDNVFSADKDEINIRIAKPFALREGDLYASPYQYINYIFGQIELYMETGNVKTAIPLLDFGIYSDPSVFNRKILVGNASETEETYTEITLIKPSEGSVLKKIKINIYTTKDERVDRSRGITAELFNENSEELYGDSYPLPTTMVVNYKNSGRVSYQVSEWVVGAKSESFFASKNTTGIPVKLLNTLREDDTINAKQPYQFDFSFPLPCEDDSFYITVTIPRKNLLEDKYTAQDETGLYTIKDGELFIDNPYLYYDASSEYGMDVTKIPNIIRARETGSYEFTDINTHYVSWNFLKGVFDPALFSEGIEHREFATATLPAYYGTDGQKQTQTIKLYITVKKLTFSGIGYGKMPVTNSETGELNLIRIDPYNDVMGYAGLLTLPTIGLIVYFNNNQDQYVFGEEGNEVLFKLYDKDNSVVADSITSIPYDETGHTLSYNNVKDDKILSLRAYIPGYENGINIYVQIESRIIKNAYLTNNSFAYKDNELKVVGTKVLNGVYFIDPYNTATFALPTETEVEFVGEKDSYILPIFEWEIYDESKDSFVALNSDKNFYTRNKISQTGTYGFYQVTADSFAGKVYTLHGSISLGRSLSGTVYKQNFIVTVIVLNRSLQVKYTTHYRYEDPLGGLLKDIPSLLSENMFVDYDEDYEYLVESGLLTSDDIYSAWSTPVLPYVNWKTQNSEDVVEYTGNFDKDIFGNVYYENTNREVLFGILSKEIGDKYELLIQSRLWDSYFTLSGLPQPVYPEGTANELKKLRTQFNNKVYASTYEILLNTYSTGTETDRQIGNYLNSAIKNEIIAESGLDRNLYHDEIVALMYERVKKAYASDRQDTEAGIYLLWQEIYDAFVAQNDEFDYHLSDYRKIKVEMYNLAQKEFTEDFAYNVTQRERVQASLRIYIDATIWDALYDRSTALEVAVMNNLLSGDNESAKSIALSFYRNHSSVSLGSAGEEAKANITAPALSLGQLVIRDSQGNITGTKSEFIFNIYSSLSLETGVDVEVLYNYSAIFNDYIEEGIRLALEDVRNITKKSSLEEYIVQKTVAYVNSILPTEFDSNTGVTTPVLGFNYVYGKFDSSDSQYEATYGRYLTQYWDELHGYLENDATKHINKLTGTAQEKWKLAYNGHLAVSGQQYICVEMRKIETEVLNDSSISSADKYSVMLDRYAEYLRKTATAEMDGYMQEAILDANMTIVEYILANHRLVSAVTDALGGSMYAFEKMFGKTVENDITINGIAEKVYDKLVASYADNSMLTAIDSAFKDLSVGSGESKARTVYHLMTNQQVNNELKERVSNIFYTFLGGDKAFEELTANLESVGLTEKYLANLIDIATNSSSAFNETNGSLNRNRFNGAFSDEEYDAYVKYVIVKNISDRYAVAGSSYANVLQGWINEAIKVNYAKGYERIYKDMPTVDNVRESVCSVKRNAFEKYIKAYEGQGDVIKVEINSGRKEAEERYVFNNSKVIVMQLMQSSTFNADYKKWLNTSNFTQKEIEEMQDNALVYYCERYADALTKETIIYAQYKYGTKAYGNIINRADLSASVKADLENAYNYKLLQNMLEKIKATFTPENSIGADERGQSSEYNIILNDLTRMFQAVSIAQNEYLTLAQTGAIREMADWEYVGKKYISAIKEYEDIIYVISGSSDCDKYQNDVVYAYIYQFDSGILDAILNTYAWRETDAYNYVKELLCDYEKDYFTSSVADIIEEEWSKQLFESFGSFATGKDGAELASQTLYLRVYNVYQNLSSDAKKGLGIDDKIFTSSDSYYNKAIGILDLFEKLEKATGADVQSAKNDLINAIVGSVSLPSKTNAEEKISFGITTSIAQAHYTEYSNNRIAVESFRAYLNALAVAGSTEYNLHSNYNKEYLINLWGALKDYPIADNTLANLFNEAQENVETVINDEIATGVYTKYSQKIIDKLMLTAAHTTIKDIMATLKGADEENFTESEIVKFNSDVINNYLVFVTQTVYDLLERFTTFKSMSENILEYSVFYPEDSEGIDGRHIIVFDKSALQDSSQAMVTAPVYVGNIEKINSSKTNVYKVDSIKYSYVPIEIKYVDFKGDLDINNEKDRKLMNTISIDPLAPNMPTTVKAYGEYNSILYDIGFVRVMYGETFYQNIYSGQSTEIRSYTVDFINSKDEVYRNFRVAAEYLDRTIDRVYVDNNAYGGIAMLDGSHDMYNAEAGCNLFEIDPINGTVLDVDNRQYILPEEMRVVFKNGQTLTFENIVWDMSEIEYSLNGQTGKNLRISSYTCELEEGNSIILTKVNVNYKNNTIRIEMTKDNTTWVQTLNNVPDSSIWNMKLNVFDRQVVSIDAMVDGELQTNYATVGLNGYLEVSDRYKLNPYDINFPQEFKITCKSTTGSGVQNITINNGNWRLESGANGDQKIMDIIMKQTTDKKVMTEFDYYGYAIKVRCTADNIELEGVGEEGYYDGGILYIVTGMGSVAEQLAQNYSYFYYNFSNVSTVKDYRKVPLSFISANVENLSSATETVFTNVRGVLGWDKKIYPGAMNLSPNITFTLVVINPQLYATLNGETNKYVITDYMSIPIDGNLQKKNDPNEPNIAEYFVKINTGDNDYFKINKDTVRYDIINNQITYRCEFNMNAGLVKLCADENGGKTITFEVTIPLSYYMYEEVEEVEFDKTPIQNALGVDIWKWTDINPDAPNYRDGIIWKLGTEMRASYMPKGITDDGMEIEFLWDLNDININCSSVDTARGYYIARGYYYSAEGVWECKELAVYIKKYDPTKEIIFAVNGNTSTNILTYYNGRYYTLPLDVNAEGLEMLRADGTYAPLDPASVTVEYKLFSDEDRRYDKDKHPLNAGVYSVRVTIADYNVNFSEELIFRLEIRAQSIDSHSVTFANESNNTVVYVFDGKYKELVAVSGLPTVKVDNWFNSGDEKDSIYYACYAEIAGRDSLSDKEKELLAKSMAYNVLYQRVSPATSVYLDNWKMQVSQEENILDELQLNALLFERFVPNWEIVEVKVNVEYRDSNNQTLNTLPVNVGLYNAYYTILPEENNGNYTFNGVTLRKTILIEQPVVDYAVAVGTLTYNGLWQNPLIAGLHDQNGTLPAGVVVTYTYRTGEGSNTQYFTNGILNVGTYVCDIEIEGGQNYPSDSLSNQIIHIVAKDLFIDITDATGSYLSPIVDISNNVSFDGLVGNDLQSMFGVPDIYTEAKEYYVPSGNYPYGIFLNGFYVRNGETALYTNIDTSEVFVHNGKKYNRMYLKPAGEEGSLYRQLNGNNEYIYADLISLIGTKENPGNYTIYVAERGDYHISYGKADPGEILLTAHSQEELDSYIANISAGQKVRIYLSATEIEDEDGETHLKTTVYNGITLNVNAGLSIIGCYDKDKNIVTYIRSITVNNGSLTLRILGFAGENSGDVGLHIGKGAGAVSIYDCYFNGNNVSHTVGIETESGYDGKLMTDNTCFTGYRNGIIAYGGNLEIVTCEFVNNVTGLQILSSGIDIQIRACSFTRNETGLVLESGIVNVLNNTFTANRVAILVVNWNEDSVLNLRIQNEYNNSESDVGINGIKEQYTE